jgi:hypothetical protein
MWSEQPVNTPQSRFVVSRPPDIPLPPPFYPPRGMRYIDFMADIGGGNPGQQMYVTLNAGEQVVLVLSCSQPITVDSGWATLLSTNAGGSIGGSMRSMVVTRTAPANETIRVCYTGPETHQFNSLNGNGFALASDSAYRFAPIVRAQGQGLPITLHDWGGDPRAFRMRVLSTNSIYAGWSGNGNESGHATNNLGYISPLSSWWHTGPYYEYPNSSVPAEYLVAPWPAGSWYTGSFGFLGPPTWVEWHIEVAPA